MVSNVGLRVLELISTVMGRLVELRFSGFCWLFV